MAAEDNIKKDAADKAIYAEATRRVFNDRAFRLLLLTKLRDFVGLAVPLLLVFWAGSDIYEPLRQYRATATGILGITAAAQALLALWSLISRWDSELAYATRAVRDQTQLRERWNKLAIGLTDDLEKTYAGLNADQALADSHDSQQGVTDKEQQTGMRAGLILYKKACVCGQMPTSYRKPIWVTRKCAVCGGN